MTTTNPLKRSNENIPPYTQEAKKTRQTSFTVNTKTEDNAQPLTTRSVEALLTLSEFQKELAARKKSCADSEFASLPKIPKIQQNADLYATAIAEIHFQKNRYHDVLAIEPTRYRVDNISDFYINACWILGGKALITQGPLKHTISDFWLMVFHSKATAIAMVVDALEIPQKCEIYWPNLGSEYTSDDGIAIKTVSETISPYWTCREIELAHGKQKRKITHLQLKSWPDHDTTSVIPLLDFIETFQTHLSSFPFVVHCSAGLGRAGTFAAAFTILENIAAGARNLDMIKNTVAKLRTERPGAVQNLSQYELIYDLVIQFCKENTALPFFQENS